MESNYEVFAVKNQTTNRQGAFTLIELVMVIVILGILAAFALPRFSDLGSAASTSKTQGLYGSVRSSMSIIYAQALIEQKASAPTASMTVDGKTVALKYGYAAASGATGVRSAVNYSDSIQAYSSTGNDNANFDWVYHLVTESGRIVSYLSPGNAIGVSSGALKVKNCYVSYKEAKLNLKAEVEIETSGC